MNRDDDHLPFRQATRLVNEFQSRVGSIGLSMLGCDLHRSVTLLMIYRAALRAPDDRQISVNAIAESLKMPTETIRRAMIGLADMGLCERAPRGYRRLPDFLSHPTIVAIGASLLAVFEDMIAGFVATGFELPAGLHDRDDTAKQAAALDIHLSAYELSETRITRPMDLYVVGTITVMNAAAITHDPVLGNRYGYDDTVPPDRYRRPATIAQLAALDGMATTTIWRHAVAAEQAGALRKVEGGYLLGEMYMNNPMISARSREKIRYVRRIFHDLAQDRYRRA